MLTPDSLLTPTTTYAGSFHSSGDSGPPSFENTPEVRSLRDMRRGRSEAWKRRRRSLSVIDVPSSEGNLARC